MASKLKDSGQRQLYDSGANRDNPEDKGRMDLIPAGAILRVSRWYEWGAKKYGDNNWQKGMPIARYMDAAIRHAFKYMAGCNDEDHLAAVIWNVMAVMHHEEFYPELQNIPSWTNKKTKWIYELDYDGEEK